MKDSEKYIREINVFIEQFSLMKSGISRSNNKISPHLG